MVLAAVIIVPALLFAAAAYYDRTQLLRAAEEDARSAATFAQEHARKAIETQELLIRELDRRVQGMTWEQIRAASAALSAEIRTMHAGLPQVSVMGLTDTEGRLLAGTTPIGPDGYHSVRHREFWTVQRDADRGTFISGTYVGAVTGRLNFAISRRRTTPTGAFDGTVHVAVASTYFSDFWSQATKGRAGVAVALIGADGTVLARFPVIGGPVPNLLPQAGALMRHLAADPRSGAYQAQSALDGAERIYTYMRVGNYPVFVIYGIAVQSVLDIWFAHLLALGGICALAAAALALAVLSAMRQTHRLNEEQARRLAVERAAQEGQRLEVLGHLAAGVAHDFRNIVHAVRNGADLIERAANQPDRVCALTGVIREAAERGVLLTQRMLDLARRGRGEGGSGDSGADATASPAEALSNVQQLLSHTLGSAYRLHCEIEPIATSVRICGDAGALEAVLVNLAVNARDAMPEGGAVLIRCRIECVGDAINGIPLMAIMPDGFLMPPGLYIRLSVTDSGVGMAPAVLARAGEPFFTTKPRGRGTGLGLAGARGFAEHAGGRLLIDSELGRGTTVNLWLPAVLPD